MPVPIFLNLPLIVWMGTVQIVLDAMHAGRMDAEHMSDPAHFTTNVSVVPFPKSLAS
jgi:hypothetical protein